MFPDSSHGHRGIQIPSRGGKPMILKMLKCVMLIESLSVKCRDEGMIPINTIKYHLIPANVNSDSRGKQVLSQLRQCTSQGRETLPRLQIRIQSHQLQFQTPQHQLGDVQEGEPHQTQVQIMKQHSNNATDDTPGTKVTCPRSDPLGSSTRTDNHLPI